MNNVRFIDSETITGYMAIWGSPDQLDEYGTYFDREDPPYMGLEFLPKPLKYEHGFDDTVERMPIGEITRVWFDETGVAFDAKLYVDRLKAVKLDNNATLYDRITSEIKEGVLATSTGSDHWADFYEDGKFKEWFVNELSLTGRPGEQRMPKVYFKGRAFRSLLVTRGETPEGGDAGDFSGQRASEPQTLDPDNSIKGNRLMPTLTELGLDNSDAAVLLSALVAEEGLDAVVEMLKAMQQTEENPEMTENATTQENNPLSILATMTPEQATLALKLINANETPARTKPAPVVVDAEKEALEAKVAAMEADVAAMRSQMLQAPPTEEDHAQNRQLIEVTDMKYDRLEARDMRAVYDWARQAQQQRIGWKTRPGQTRAMSDEFFKVMTLKSAQELEKKGHLRNDDVDATFRTPDRKTPIRANEVMQSTLANYGDEWVGVLYATDLLTVIRQETPLYAKMRGLGMQERTVGQGYESEIVPVEGADPTWYSVPQTTAESGGRPVPKLTSSQVGTTKIQITLAKLGCAILYTGELEEDSLVAMAPELRRKMDVSGQEMLENLIINGDVTLTNNINNWDNVISGDTLGSFPFYTAFDGVLHQALIDNSGNAIDYGGVSLTEKAFLDLRKYLGTNGKAGSNPGKLLYVMDNFTNLSMLELALNVQAEKRSAASTLDVGMSIPMWGTETYASAEMDLATTGGYIADSANTLGRLALVRPDRFAFAWKRRVTTEVQRHARADTTEFISYMRSGFEPIVLDECVSMYYNINVS